MAKIVIKKRISLDFLGAEHKEDYLLFKSMPIREYETLLADLEGVDNKTSLNLTVKILKDNFLSGKFQGEDVTKDNLEDFDLETLIVCLERFTGRTHDPKD